MVVCFLGCSQTTAVDGPKHADGFGGRTEILDKAPVKEEREWDENGSILFFFLWLVREMGHAVNV